MPTGRIKYYNPNKGFGFIAQDNGEADVFMHISAIRWAYDEIRVGQQVKYDIVESKRGLVAQNVEAILSPTEQKRVSQGKTLIPRNPPPLKKQGSRFGRASSTQPRVSTAKPSDKKPLRTSRVKTALPKSIEASPDQQPHAQEAPKKKAKTKPADGPTFGDLYMQKQIRLQTPMFFGLYDHVLLPAIVNQFTKYEFMLQKEDSEVQELPKTDVKYCYKAEDAEKVEAMARYNEAIKAQNLKPIIRRKERYHVDTRTIQQTRKDRCPIEVTMREGEIFRGLVDWVSRYEIKMILENGSKILLFRHAICDFKASPPETKDEAVHPDELKPPGN